jgi:hypothetical protein
MHGESVQAMENVLAPIAFLRQEDVEEDILVLLRHEAFVYPGKLGCYIKNNAWVWNCATAWRTQIKLPAHEIGLRLR